MNGELVSQEGTQPGFGVAGVMMCPLMRIPCLKSACMLWSELTYVQGTPEERRVGNCAITWIPILLTENTQELKRAREHAVT